MLVCYNVVVGLFVIKLVKIGDMMVIEVGIDNFVFIVLFKGVLLWF